MLPEEGTGRGPGLSTGPLRFQPAAVDDGEREEFFPLPSRTCVNSEERTVDFRRWKELMDSGLNIDYRCMRCRACNDCRNADQTEKVSLRQDAEDDMIKNSVTWTTKSRRS